MDEHTSHELAYKKGYAEGHEKGYKEGFLSGFDSGKQDAMKWIPVTDRLPEDSRGVILCTRSRIVGVGFYDKNTRNWVQNYSGGGIFIAVTHWMPLPEPPKGE